MCRPVRGISWAATAISFLEHLERGSSESTDRRGELTAIVWTEPRLTTQEDKKSCEATSVSPA
jgi:hypothetical protein